MDENERKIMEWARSELAVAESRLYEQIVSTFRWLMATLFAANGGGIIALLGNQTRMFTGRNHALLLFALGVVSSILMGTLSALVSYQASVKMAKMRIKLDEGLLLGEAPIDALKDFISQTKITWKTWFPSYVGVASLGFFIAALTVIGCSLA